MLTKTGNSNAESADVTVEIDPVLSLRLSKDEINLNPSPIPEGTFVYDTLSAIVDTNNRTGYTLTMNSETEEAALVQEDNDTKIPTLANEVTVTSENQNNFTMNHWGYALTDAFTDSETSFLKIPALSTPATIKTSDAPIVNDITPVSFATRVNTSLPSGTYKNTVVFTAVANHIPMAFDGITYMQDMTADICAKETTPDKTATKTTHYRTSDTNLVPEAILTDSRDGEQYIVRKLADGNCWMSQNLRLQLSTSKPLTPADSDVASNWTPDLNSQTTTGTTWGDYNNATDVNKARSYVNTENAEYGGYYNWYAATASTGLYDNTTTAATSSICPKGWQLPPNDGAKSYKNLITTAYGLSVKTEDSAPLQNTPFSFPLSGRYNYSGSIDYQGSLGLFWSAMPTSSANSAYYLRFYSSDGGPQRVNYKALGFTVRCVARGPQQTINFNSSSADSGIASASTDLGGNIDLSYYSSLFKKDGYTLKQWRDQDGNLYDAQSDPINVNPGNKPEITLTAVWSPNFFRSSLTTMQGMTNYICNEVATPSKNAATIVTSASDYTDPSTQVPQVTLKDTRDNNTYTVKKLADGNCWMTQNLRLVGSKTLTSADSDVSSNWTLPAASTSGFTDSKPNIAQVAPVNTEYGNGAYYSWTAATAGTGNASITADGAEAPSSICPKGWRLPYSGTSQTGSKSFKYLMDTYGYTTGDQITAQPLQFAYAGSYRNSVFYGGGGYGLYSSSTAASPNNAYYLRTDPSLAKPNGSGYERSNGFSVRCVAR